ncbi:MAG: hypothetical protein ACJAUL_001536 [Paraglaciecola sp.]|jgi:uncharacterized protein (DUF1499 family)
MLIYYQLTKFSYSHNNGEHPMKTLVSLISLLAILLVALPGLLYKFGIVELGSAFATLRYGVYVGLAALVLLLLQVIFMRKNISWATAGVSALLAIVAVGLPMSLMSKAKSVPPIHDISTDLLNPPKFEAIVPLRMDAPNPVAYPGEDTAVQQRQAYPELVTQQYAQPQDQVFDAALALVNNLGWELANADKARGVIEATHTTAWFGFKDDVVIRIAQQDQVTALDIRSKSRVGKSDLGKNAERIHEFLDNLASTLLTQG